MRHHSTEIVAINKNAVRHFRTIEGCARFLGVPVYKIEQAMENRRLICGWYIKEDKKTLEQMTFGAKIQVDGARYNPIFTRKPYSSTNIWRKFDER